MEDRYRIFRTKALSNSLAKVIITKNDEPIYSDSFTSDYSAKRCYKKLKKRLILYKEIELELNL